MDLAGEAVRRIHLAMASGVTNARKTKSGAARSTRWKRTVFVSVMVWRAMNAD
jgi:hypothetical protein